jgi:flagellar hook assembly protein FlgD
VSALVRCFMAAAFLIAAFAVPATTLGIDTAFHPKVVIVVGPVGEYNSYYKNDANEIAAEALRYTPNVIKIYTPRATWARVKAAAQGANILVYLGHGNGWPSIYAPWQPYTKDGFGLDPDTGADGVKHVYYGEFYVARDIRLAPNSVVLLYHLCYAAGSTSPGMAEGTFAQAKQRVDNFGAGFLAAGARAVLADSFPAQPVVDYMRQIFTTNRSVWSMFTADPTYHGHMRGPYPSLRTPGLRYALDPTYSSPRGFYRSIVGDLSLTSTSIRSSQWIRTDLPPPDFAVPGNAEVSDPAGAGLFATAAEAADPTATPASSLAQTTDVRLTAGADAMADGTRIFAATTLDKSVSGFLRASSLVPADSAAPKIWSLDRVPLFSPNGDGLADDFSLGVRFSEPLDASLRIARPDGSLVEGLRLSGDVLRFTWDFTIDGVRIPDGDYTWRLTAADALGNGSVSAAGTFRLDATRPRTTATISGTAGDNGWLRSAATITLRASDNLTGVASTTAGLDGATRTTYTGARTVTAQGRHTLAFGSVDGAGNRESRSASFAVDSVAPKVVSTITGTPGDVAGWYRSPVSVAASSSDATSGMASLTTALDSAPAESVSGPLDVTLDGSHQLVLTARDLAGNVTTQTRTFVVDTVVPVVTLPDGAAGVRIFSPNGDRWADTVAVPVEVSEAASVTVVVRNSAGVPVRSARLTAAKGSNAFVWDGRSSSGSVVPDGRYGVELTARDPAGNVGAVAVTPLDVYGALGFISRTPVAFYPQDRDSLATRSTISFRLLRAANVSLQVIDANGQLVRARYSANRLAAGTYSWVWNGTRADGSYVPEGTYRFVLSATDGTRIVTQTTAVYAGAFRIATSTASAQRGTAITVTAVSTEPLSTAPRLIVSQPGLAAWSVVMVKVASSTWRVTIRPKTGGSVGLMGLTVTAKDTYGHTNTSRLRLTLA